MEKQNQKSTFSGGAKWSGRKTFFLDTVQNSRVSCREQETKEVQRYGNYGGLSSRCGRHFSKGGENSYLKGGWALRGRPKTYEKTYGCMSIWCHRSGIRTAIIDHKGHLCSHHEQWETIDDFSIGSSQASSPFEEKLNVISQYYSLREEDTTDLRKKIDNWGHY